MSSEAVIETQGLTKRYGRTWALRGVDLRVERGQVYGLLGPNGAGKATTANIVNPASYPRQTTSASVLFQPCGRACKFAFQSM